MTRPTEHPISPQLALKDDKMETRGSDDEEPVICLGGCHRALTSQISRARGYGTDCWRKLHGRTAPHPRLAAPRTVVPGEDQPELPIDDQLAIWSD